MPVCMFCVPFFAWRSELCPPETRDRNVVSRCKLNQAECVYIPVSWADVWRSAGVQNAIPNCQEVGFQADRNSPVSALSYSFGGACSSVRQSASIWQDSLCVIYLASVFFFRNGSRVGFVSSLCVCICKCVYVCVPVCLCLCASVCLITSLSLYLFYFRGSSQPI
jgi:hypothetical protein